MKKFIIGTLCLILLGGSLPGFADLWEEELEHIREKFRLAVIEEAEVQELIAYIEKGRGKNRGRYPPVILAYYGALEGLRGKHALFPPLKYYYITEAMAKMNQAVTRDQEDLETRFIRFIFFHQLPEFFGAGRQAREDLPILTLKFLEKDYSRVPEKVQKEMMLDILKWDKLDSANRERLEELIEEGLE